MPQITKIALHAREPNRREIYIDGKRCARIHANVVARHRLREGMELSAEQLAEILASETKQKCFDQALSYLESRLHSRSELRRKLAGRKYDAKVIESALDELQRLGYIDDQRFAQTKALAAAQHKQHGRRRAFAELLKSGVNGQTAQRALDEVYRDTDQSAIAGQLARKHAPRLKKLDRPTARRRLAGMLRRRGFDYDAIKPVIDEVLGDDAGE